MLFSLHESNIQKNSRVWPSYAVSGEPFTEVFFRKIMSLPFIPQNTIMELIEQFLNDPQVVFCIGEYPVLLEFLRYFHRTWVETFLIEMWNVFERPSRLRTTNYCEGWNNAWNTHTRRASPNIWLAIKFLKIQQKTPKIKFFICSKVPVHRRKKGNGGCIMKK